MNEEARDMTDVNAASEEYGADRSRCCKGWTPCASARACISATPMTAPACTTWCIEVVDNAIDEALAGIATGSTSS